MFPVLLAALRHRRFTRVPRQIDRQNVGPCIL